MGGSDVGIIIVGSFLLTETVKVQANPTWPFYLHSFFSFHIVMYSYIASYFCPLSSLDKN